MLKSSCICKNVSSFIPVIDYSKGIFPQYSGIIIGKCTNCGVLKTIIPDNKQYPQQSHGKFYEENKNKFKNIFLPVVKEVQKYKKTGTVLDIGCSSGILMEVLKENNF